MGIFFNIERVTQATKIVTLISVIIGVYVTVSSALEALNASRVNTIHEIKPVIDEELSIRKKMAAYMEKQLDDDTSYVKEAIAQGKSGESLYYSDRLNEYREITRYYNQLGGLLAWEGREFDIVFDRVAFPDNFYLKTKEIRQLVLDNWHEKAVPLKDFFSDFDALCLHYQKERASQGFRHLELSACKS